MTSVIPVAVTPTWSDALVMGTVDVGIVVLVLAMGLCMVRLIKGPHLADRALAVDTFSLVLIGLVVLLTIRLKTLMFFDGILVLALLSFAGTVAMAQYIARPHLQNRQRPSDRIDRSSETPCA